MEQFHRRPVATLSLPLPNGNPITATRLPATVGPPPPTRLEARVRWMLRGLLGMGEARWWLAKTLQGGTQDLEACGEASGRAGRVVVEQPILRLPK